MAAYSNHNLFLLRVHDRLPARGQTDAVDVRRVADAALALNAVVGSLRCLRQLALAPGDQLRVLLVSERVRQRASLQAALRREHHVLAGFGYADALVRLATDVVDAIVVDQRLGPTGSAASLLSEVRARWPSVRRVLVAPRGRAGQSTLLAEGIAHHVLRAPVERRELLASLQ